MADDRRIITGTYISPRESNNREELVGTKSILDSDINKTLGGKSTVTTLSNNQWSNDWTSMNHPNTTQASQITFGGSNTNIYQLRNNTTTVDFLYIKNLDDSNDITVSLEAAGTYTDFEAGSAYNWNMLYDEEIDPGVDHWELKGDNWETLEDSTTNNYWQNLNATDNSDDWEQLSANWESYTATLTSWEEYNTIGGEVDYHWDQRDTLLWEAYTITDHTEDWDQVSREWSPGFSQATIIPAGASLYLRSKGTGGHSFTLNQVHILSNSSTQVSIEYVIAN